MSKPESSIILRALRALSSVPGMNDWPPKPGLTDMSRMMSTLSITYLGDGGFGRRASRVGRSGAPNCAEWPPPNCAART